MEGNDWDLSAVVRGCRRSGEKLPVTTTEMAPLFPLEAETKSSRDVSDNWRTGFEELEEFFKPFFSKPQLLQQSSFSSAGPAATAPVEPTVRAPQRPPNRRRRKNQQKKVVCHVPADGVSSDMWAWRKYGQKPIKGSPYPRGYYRCSSSKGCPAKKQMERSRADPGTFIITYTAEHNHPVPTHRNSLAGSTRQKVSSPSRSPPPPPPSAAAELSPTTPLTASASTEDEDEDEDDGLLLVEDMEVLGEDDFVIMGDDASASSSAAAAAATSFEALDDQYDLCFEDRFFSHPWLSTNDSGNAAAAAGGQ